jgi:formylmethanofuran dehydrogenase subunit D
MPQTYILIPGRTSDQGCGISEGKFQPKYQKQIQSLQMSPGDMQRLGVRDGHWVRLTSETGSVEVQIVTAPKDELPDGLLFIAYGDISCRLMSGDTHGSGMPTSKGIDVTLEVLHSANANSSVISDSSVKAD